jgi:hypothetical protein
MMMGLMKIIDDGEPGASPGLPISMLEWTGEGARLSIVASS